MFLGLFTISMASTTILAPKNHVKSPFVVLKPTIFPCETHRAPAGPTSTPWSRDTAGCTRWPGAGKEWIFPNSRFYIYRYENLYIYIWKSIYIYKYISINISIYMNEYIYISRERERSVYTCIYIYIIHTSEYIYRRYHMIPRRLQMVSPARLVANLQQGIQTS